MPLSPTQRRSRTSKIPRVARATTSQDDHRPHHAGFGPEAPYVFAAVELAEGPLMYSRLAGRPPEDLIGRSVRSVFVDHGPEQKVPFFELDDT